MPFEWKKAGLSLDVSWLATKPWGQLPPPDEDQDGNLLQQTDIGVARCVDKDGGLGLPWSFMLWHWSMVGVFTACFLGVFCATTPFNEIPPEHHQGGGFLCAILGLPATFPWLTFVQKIMVFWYIWESLGLGVLHGPMHAKLNPPFQDWWYRLTPGTIKYPAPFMPTFFGKTRNWLDVVVEGVLTYVFAVRILIQPSVEPYLVWPLFVCGIYEFIFDYGQHLHTYGTQLLHIFACMSVPVSQGQVVGIQMFLSWFYFCSGWCKIGPWFKHLNIANLMTAKYMVGKPWSGVFRRVVFKDCESKDPDYHHTGFAMIFSILCGLLEALGPLLCLSNNDVTVSMGIFFLVCMHIYIISTLVVDVFTWNFVDAIYYCILFGVYRTGFDWEGVAHMHPWLCVWLAAHALYSVYGNWVPGHVPYVVAHRHAAVHFVQGVLLIKPEAAGKLANLKAHAGLPQPIDPENKFGMRWLGQWLAFHLLMAYFWLWNLPSKMLLPLVEYALDGKPYSDYVMMHSVLLFDALVAHVRFDGLSSLTLVEQLGEVCDFQPGECRLCWVGAFQSFPAGCCLTATATWKLVDSKLGVLKEGRVTVADLEDPDYKKPSDCGMLVEKIRDTPETNGLQKPLMTAAV